MSDMASINLVDIQTARDAVKAGWMEHVGIDEKGEKLYRLTEAGREYAEERWGLSKLEVMDRESDVGPAH